MGKKKPTKKDVQKMIDKATKRIKRWDIKQDKALIPKKRSCK